MQDFERESNAELYRRAKRLIPGGTQLLSKRPELYAPDRWPAYYREARGCEIVDWDGRRFVDMTTNAVGSCLLGYANQKVNDAVTRRVQSGSMCTLNSPEEIELAELLIQLHPWADAVRYCRTGGESMAVAVRIARAATGRDRVAFCGYHGWSDWYLAANLPHEQLAEHLLSGLRPAGVPGGLSGTALPFRYNDFSGLQQIVSEYGSDLAAIVMEPLRHQMPSPGFLERALELTQECGAVLVFDEISAGWRFWLGGSHMKFGVEPDIAVFAKAISNGYPMGAVVGRAKVMDAAQDSFISSTFWTDGIGPAAAVATLREMQQTDVPKRIQETGTRVLEGWNRLGQKHELPARASGLPALAHLGFEHPDHLALGTLFTVRMLERGFLAGSQFYPTMAHQPEHVSSFLAAVDEVFVEISQSLQAGDVRSRLDSGVRQTGFQRLT